VFSGVISPPLSCAANMSACRFSSALMVIAFIGSL